VTDRLTFSETTPLTEAVENGFESVIRLSQRLSGELQRAISSVTVKPSFDATVETWGRVGVSLVRAWASTWSTAADNVGLLASGQVEYWWSDKLETSSWTDGSKPLEPEKVLGLLDASDVALRVVAKSTPGAVQQRNARVAVASLDERGAQSSNRVLVRRRLGLVRERAQVAEGFYVRVSQTRDFIPNVLEITLVLEKRPDPPDPDPAKRTVVAMTEPILALISPLPKP